MSEIDRTNPYACLYAAEHMLSLARLALPDPNDMTPEFREQLRDALDELEEARDELVEAVSSWSE